MSRIQDYWRKRFGQTSSETTTDEGQEFPQLREFVYIDQRSVQSLLASTDSGRVAAEQTNLESDANTSEHHANAGVGAGPVKIGADTRRVSQQGRETENVYSFDLIQSKFTRLYEHEEITPRISLDADGAYELRNDPELADLDRGTVLELRGNIQLYSLYRVFQAIEYIDTAVPDESIVDEGMIQFIEGSLGSKIPIEIEVDGLSLDDDERLYSGSSGKKFNIVALLDESNLWTEPIQTLASNKQFRIFCRIESVQPNWYPIKLIRVLESISPELADEYNTMLEGELQTAMDTFEASVEASSDRSGVDKQTVREFTNFLAEKATTMVDDNQVDKVVENTIEAYSPETMVTFEQDVELEKATYQEFTKVVSEDVFSEEPHTLRSEYRQDLSARSEEVSERDFTAHLEVNVIGIYW